MHDVDEDQVMLWNCSHKKVTRYSMKVALNFLGPVARFCTAINQPVLAT
jgi:hypothetical protein